jgi:hypothetical protein
MQLLNQNIKSKKTKADGLDPSTRQHFTRNKELNKKTKNISHTEVQQTILPL